MEPPKSQAPPFLTRLIQYTGGDDNRQLRIRSLLPASYRTKDDDLAPPRLDDITWMKKELDVVRLNKLSARLWIVGRPMPPRPLHYQLVLGRDIFVVEQMDLHLVWTTGRLYLKPIPRFLLEPDFWSTQLACRLGCPCPEGTGHVDAGCDHRKLWRCAVGFLFSYAALIGHESDFLLAKEKHLLPKEVEWADWRTFVEELGIEHIYSKMNERFFYGELRLSRLNKLLLLPNSFSLRGYMSHWHHYGDFFHDNFAWLASATLYIAVVLTAMQVGLATDSLAQNKAFQSASFGFTVLSITGPLAASGLILFAFCCIFVSNWITTVVYKRERLRRIQLHQGEA